MSFSQTSPYHHCDTIRKSSSNKTVFMSAVIVGARNLMRMSYPMRQTMGKNSGSGSVLQIPPVMLKINLGHKKTQIHNITWRQINTRTYRIQSSNPRAQPERALRKMFAM